MKPHRPQDLLYLSVFSCIISGFTTGVAWGGVWLINHDRLWLAIFIWGVVITWIVEVSKDE